jgi:hypothetical protein
VKWCASTATTSGSRSAPRCSPPCPFLPESEAAIPSPAYIDEFLLWTIECEVIEIDAFLGHVVISRRNLVERGT